MDNFKRMQFLKNELKQKTLKSIKTNEYVSYNLRYKALFLQSKFHKNKVLNNNIY